MTNRQVLQPFAQVLRALQAFGLMCMVLAAFSAQAQISNRLALVIGNNDYLSVERLKNARNDAKLMASTLRDANFDVTEANDLDKRKLWKAIESFSSRIKKGDDVVFFFAGHGVQIGSEPVLLPTDIEAESDTQVLRESVPLAEVQKFLKEARFALLVIDACRDNPFPQKGTRSVGAARGIPMVEAADGMAIIMSAGRGQKALDSVPDQTNDNGLFTYEFVRSIRVPGKDLRSALTDVRERVEDKAKRANNAQRPSLVDETRGNFYFFDASKSAVAAISPQAAAGPAGAAGVRIQSAEEAEQEFWNVIRESRDLLDFVDYEKRYPNGRFAAQAARQIRMLRNFSPVTNSPPRAQDLIAANAPVVAAPAPALSAAQAAVAAVDLANTPRRPPDNSSGIVLGAGAGASIGAVALARPTPGPLGSPLLAPVESAAARPQAALVPVAGEIMVGGTRFKGQFAQEPADRTLTGSGEIRWANGDVFVGNLLKGKRHGEGEITWANGQRYKGVWSADQPNGQGQMKFASGDLYEGNLLNGQSNGIGRMNFASGDTYSGEFALGTSNGNGIYVWKSGQRYEGQWVNDKPQGRGKLSFASGDVFEGRVNAGVPEGEGVMRYSSADTYTGSFVNGKPNGKGRYNWKGGDVYVGDWSNGLKHGTGSLTWSNGDRWEGEFKDDAQTANGKLIRKTP